MELNMTDYELCPSISAFMKTTQGHIGLNGNLTLIIVNTCMKLYLNSHINTHTSL